MQSKSLNITKTMKAELETKNVINLRFTHRNTPIPLLEKLTFQEPRKILSEIHAFDFVKECAILQTCNRVEIYAAVFGQDLTLAMSKIAEYWQQKTEVDKEKFYQILKGSLNSQALSHLMRLISGLDSMIVGEDQILGQIQKAFKEAKKCGTIGPLLKTTFEKAIKTGKKVRFKTKINRGAVSIGSAAVQLLEEAFYDLKDKEVIIIGAGETGGLVGKALAFRKHAVIFVANRTYERGVRLAKLLGGQAVRFDKVKNFLTNVDAIIVATTAPHYVLTRKMLQEVLVNRERKKLFIMDLSQPRNVEESIASLPNVLLRNIDDLHGFADTNLRMRRKEIEKAEAIVKKEFDHLEILLKQEQANFLISALFNKAENTRREELKKALGLLGKITDEQKKVVHDLTLILIERILYYPTRNLRQAALSSDFNTMSVAQKLFNLNIAGDQVK